MIRDVMWPQIQSFIESVSKEQGLLLPATCGVDRDSAVIQIDDGRFGVGLDLSLTAFQPPSCVADLRNALPKLPNINLP